LATKLQAVHVHSGSQDLTPITKDGDENLFYGVPDWVYEEEVFSGNTGTWWSDDGLTSG
jgi:dipeptidyl aminopeptidase